MLAEFLLTPDALADDTGPGGSDVIRALRECLFPRRAVPVALICKLGEEWERSASRRIARIANTNQRIDAMSLFQKLLAERCVTRPSVQLGGDLETDWMQAGAATAAQVPLRGIIVSANSAPPEPLGVGLRVFVSDEFWDTLDNPRTVRRDIRGQEEVLRAICAHADWLTIRVPQIRGGCDDEIVTVKQIIKLSNQLPAGFRKTSIDLQICLQERIPEGNLVRAVSGELSEFVRRGVNIRLTLWPARHFINRELLAGDLTRTSTGECVPRPLWWITMTHVAVGGKNAANAGEPGNTWSLFSRQKAYERHEQIKADAPIQVVDLK